MRDHSASLEHPRSVTFEASVDFRRSCDGGSPLGHCFDAALRTDACDEGRPARITVSTDDPERVVLHFRALGGDGDDGGRPEPGAFLRANFDLGLCHANFRAILEEFFAN